MQQRTKRMITICIPVLNEEANIARMYETLTGTLAPLENRYDIEFLFTDNHSSDLTFARLHALARTDHRIRVYRFASNVGFQKSILTGYLQSRGDAIIQIDCDLQDPPTMILKFVEMWEQGYHVVYGIRASRKEGWLITKLRDLFYYLVDLLSNHPLQRQAGDFRLVTRPVLEAVRGMEDSFPYLRGTIAGLGFNQIGIAYSRDARQAGESKFRFSSLVALAIDGILSTSIIPLRLAVYLGLAMSATAAAMVIYYLFSYFTRGATWPSGFATLVVLVTFGIGMNSLFLGIIGEYLGRLYVQSKRRPVSLIEFSIESGVLRNHAPTPGFSEVEITPPSFGSSRGPLDARLAGPSEPES